MLNRHILKLAVPSIISNITIPLVGMIDLIMVGWLGGDSLIAGLAVGTTIFNFLYWNFGFLRMGTGGFTAQAFGARDFRFATQTLVRALMLSVMIGLAMVMLQLPIVEFSLGIIEGSEGVENSALGYFYARIWAAPATMSLYAFKGWFIGMQNSRSPMWIALLINSANIAVSYFLAFTMGWGIAGIGAGTAIAQWCGVLMAIIIVKRYYSRFFNSFTTEGLFDRAELAKFFKVNTDIFIRTLCLVIVFTYFTVASSYLGDTVLAANSLMMQMFMLFSYMMDGFGHAGEALVGKYYGSGNKVMLRRTVIRVIQIGGVVAVFSTFVYALWGENVLMIFSPSEELLAVANEYIVWAMMIPMAGFLAFLVEGFLIGITASSIMRNAVIISSVLFFACYFALLPLMANHALWLAFLIYLLLRGILQLFMARKKLLPQIKPTDNTN